MEVFYIAIKLENIVKQLGRLTYATERVEENTNKLVEYFSETARTIDTIADKVSNIDDRASLNDITVPDDDY